VVFSHSFSFASSIAMNGQQDGSTLPAHLWSDPRNWEMESGVSTSHTHAISETLISVLRGTAVTRNFHESSYLGVYIFNCLSYCLFVCLSICLFLSDCLPVCIASFASRNLNVLQTHQHQHQIQDSGLSISVSSRMLNIVIGWAAATKLTPQTATCSGPTK